LCNVDRKTGLPIRTVDTCGCVVRESEVRRAQGHNDHVEQYIRWNGLPRNSLKPWEQELFHLAEYFDDWARIGPPFHLAEGGPANVSPDGKSSVRPAAVANSGGLDVFIFAENNRVSAQSIVCEDGKCELVWGPGGSRFVIFRSFYDDRVHFAAYDLKTGQHLRDEREFHPGHPRAYSSKVVEAIVRAFLAGSAWGSPQSVERHNLCSASWFGLVGSHRVQRVAPGWTATASDESRPGIEAAAAAPEGTRKRPSDQE
jgi:hypothetical protein